MKKLNSLIVASLLGSVTANAGHFSWGVSVGFGGPVYCPPPVVYTPVVYQPQMVVVQQPVVQHVVYPQPVVVVAPSPVVYYPAPTIWIGGGHYHRGHRR